MMTNGRRKTEWFWLWEWSIPPVGFYYLPSFLHQNSWPPMPTSLTLSFSHSFTLTHSLSLSIHVSLYISHALALSLSSSLYVCLTLYISFTLILSLFLSLFVSLTFSLPLSFFIAHSTLVHFHRRVRVDSVCEGAARFPSPPPEVDVTRTEPHWAVLVPPYSSVVVARRLKGLRGISSYTHRFRWLVGRIVPSVRHRDNKKQIQYPRGVSAQRRKLSLLKKMLCKSLTSFLDFLHSCSLFIVRILLFPWIY